MVDVQGLDVLVQDVVGSGSELSSPAKDANEVLKGPMHPGCLVYEAEFHGLWEGLKQSGEDVFERVQAVIWNPPYNLCRSEGSVVRFGA